MWPVIVLFCSVIYISDTNAKDASNDPNVEIYTYLNDVETFSCTIDSDVLFLNKDFNLKLVSTFPMLSGRCYTDTHYKIISWDYIYKNSIETKLNASMKMNGIWNCEFSFLMANRIETGPVPCDKEEIQVIDSVFPVGLVSGCGVMVVVVIGVVCYILLHLRKRKLASRNLNQTVLEVPGYEEKPAHIQQFDVHYSEPSTVASNNRNLNDLYTKPQPKHLRQNQVEHGYANLQLNNANGEDLTYATIEVCDKLISNSVRGNTQRSDYADIYTNCPTSH